VNAGTIIWDKVCCSGGFGECNGKPSCAGKPGLRAVGTGKAGEKYGLYCFSGLRAITERLYMEAVEGKNE
jgi:hypothetical protein